MTASGTNTRRGRVKRLRMSLFVTHWTDLFVPQAQLSCNIHIFCLQLITYFAFLCLMSSKCCPFHVKLDLLRYVWLNLFFEKNDKSVGYLRSLFQAKISCSIMLKKISIRASMKHWSNYKFRAMKGSCMRIFRMWHNCNKLIEAFLIPSRELSGLFHSLVYK